MMKKNGKNMKVKLPDLDKGRIWAAGGGKCVGQDRGMERARERENERERDHLTPGPIAPQLL